MKINLTDESGRSYTIEIDPTDTVMLLKAKTASLMHSNSNAIKLFFKGTELPNFNNLIQSQVKEGDQVHIIGGLAQMQQAPQQPRHQQVQPHNNYQEMQIKQALMNEALQLRAFYSNSTSELNMLLERDPLLAQAILSDDINDTVHIIYTRKKKLKEEERRRQLEDMKLNSDPFNVEAQKEIEKRIELERHEANYNYAQEHMPESFIQTSMLYINMEINGHKFQAFIDSGAQSTIISEAFAEKVGLTKDVDRRFKGKAVGVGNCNIVGRIHSAKLMIGKDVYIQASLQVLDSIGLDFLFGLDNLKKFRTSIDLQNNWLSFPHEGVNIPFLKDHEIKKESNKHAQSIDEEKLELSNEEKEKRISTMVEIGASRTQAQTLLQKCNWNTDYAAAAFYEGGKS